MKNYKCLYNYILRKTNTLTASYPGKTRGRANKQARANLKQIKCTLIAANKPEAHKFSPVYLGWQRTSDLWAWYWKSLTVSSTLYNTYWNGILMVVWLTFIKNNARLFSTFSTHIYCPSFILSTLFWPHKTLAKNLFYFIERQGCGEREQETGIFHPLVPSPNVMVAKLKPVVWNSNMAFPSEWQGHNLLGHFPLYSHVHKQKVGPVGEQLGLKSALTRDAGITDTSSPTASQCGPHNANTS